MNVENYINAYLTLGNEKQRSMYEWFKAEGKYYQYDEDLTREIIGKDINKVHPKGCFENSFRFIHKTDGYIIGLYTTSIGIAFEHAFNHYNGKGVDVTSSMMGFEVEELYGVEVPTEVLLDYFSEGILTPILHYYYFNYINKS